MCIVLKTLLTVVSSLGDIIDSVGAVTSRLHTNYACNPGHCTQPGPRCKSGEVSVLDLSGHQDLPFCSIMDSSYFDTRELICHGLGGM